MMSLIAQEILSSDALRICRDAIEVRESNGHVPLLGASNGSDFLCFENEPLLLSPYTWSIQAVAACSAKATVDTPRASIELDVTIINAARIHFHYVIRPRARARWSSVQTRHSILFGADPDFTWVPLVRPEDDMVIADHVFRSPAIVYQKGKYAIAVVPDIQVMQEHRAFPMFMDLDVKPTTSRGDHPVVSFGFGNYKPVDHVLFVQTPRKKIKITKGSELIFAYDILIFKDVPVSAILEQVNDAIWNQFGKHHVHDDPAPQVLPLEACVYEGFKAIFERHKCWGEFSIEGIPCGGIWNRSWMGARKKPFAFITPRKLDKYRKSNQNDFVSRKNIVGKLFMRFSTSLRASRMIDRVTRWFPLMKRTAEIQNNAWFLNVRTAYALKYFGRQWNRPDLVDKANKMINVVLSLSRTSGIFPAMVLPEGPNATRVSTVNGLRAFSCTNDFNVVDACLSMYWILKSHADIENVPGILEKSRALFTLISKIQLGNGAIPTLIGFDKDGKLPVARDTLIDSASSGAPLMFIMEYYKISSDALAIDVGRKIASYIQKEIIPVNKWHDFEPFFSCTHLPLDFYDHRTKSHVMNALCIYWCTEGLKELFKATKDHAFLDAGEQVLNVLCLFQQAWNLPFIGFQAFGGFCSQNADAELSDARQGLFVRTFMEYYDETGKPAYMERGIAVLRACWALQLLREHEKVAPANIAGIETIDGVDRGVVFENFGHSGWNFRVIGFVMFDWGVGTSAMATAYVKRHYGDLYLDFARKKAWGIDGIVVTSGDFQGSKVILDIKTIPGKTKILLKARNPPEGGAEITINGAPVGRKTRDELASGVIWCEISP
nr:hypothetical protein [Candidatus Sigynarchaeota archaeon]